jgi:outer membrane biosynthesis protein TonB
MATSAVLHAALVIFLAFFYEYAPSATPITEITMLTPEDLEPPAPVPPATQEASQPAPAPAEPPPAKPSPEPAPARPAPAARQTPPPSPAKSRAPAAAKATVVAKAPAATPPPRVERGRARAQEVASVVRAGDMLKGIDAMVGDLPGNAASAKNEAGKQRALVQSEARAAAGRARALAGSAAGEVGGDALERTTRRAKGRADGATLAREPVAIGNLETVGPGGGAAGSGAADGRSGGGARTSESLMAVVHRYAGGIKNCYDPSRWRRSGR